MIKGHYCSRCLFGSGCQGCVLSNATPDISLKPGDFLSVSFNDLSLDVIQEVGIHVIGRVITVMVARPTVSDHTHLWTASGLCQFLSSIVLISFLKSKSSKTGF